MQIAQALEPLSPMWLEEMLPQDNLSAYRDLSISTRLPLCLSERLMTIWQFRDLLAFVPRGLSCRIWRGAAGSHRAARSRPWPRRTTCRWCPNCGGPVLHWASAHFAAAIPNLHILETVRRHYLDEYKDLMTRDLRRRASCRCLPARAWGGVERRPPARRRRRSAPLPRLEGVIHIAAEARYRAKTKVKP